MEIRAIENKNTSSISFIWHKQKIGYILANVPRIGDGRDF